jgi:hypothetical protein
MTGRTITRRELREAVEAGIAAAWRCDSFTEADADRLRRVALTAPRVLRGSYAATVEGCVVGCPIFQAYGENLQELTWDLVFASAYDAVTFSVDWAGREARHPYPDLLEVVES